MDSLTVINVIGAPFSFAGFVGLIFGLFAPIGVYRFIEKYKGQAEHHFKIYVSLIVLSVYFLCFFSVRAEKTAIITQKNKQETEMLRRDFMKCYHDTYMAVKDWIDKSEEVSKANTDQDDALFDWVDKLTEPPDDIDALPINDPRHVAWFREIAREWKAKVLANRNKRLEGLEIRNQINIPEPTCGDGSP